MPTGNKIVFLFPATLMVLLFIGGYFYLQQETEFSNEELKDVVSFDVEAEAIENQLTVQVEWDWNAMPTDGLYGMDYISIAMMEPADEIVFTEGDIRLFYGHEEIFRSKGKVVSDGVIFSFPNELRDFESFGNLGEIVVDIEGEQLEKTELTVYYVHTWSHHLGMLRDSAKLDEPSFENGPNVPYWVLTKPVEYTQK
ncbi:hypothetical protein P4631_13075 [Halalkalibacterium halodurans]|uniref:BH1436 protein n=1 Tax=Halalkalibacterium halodurans (strain ATCC BAA-125 / DSM 18197 / FERM 7344 / JCM 9153 / C-125) TaxID=272558 RepID=Q9KCY3_HALH5|nr:hypothetical protein [Halalkalibacterium halodurans]MED4173363.1 hypothetical protein [Halalkalibacterium halodurans]BAB05155.1 BH1436 [Halalkalibacterium halodurans C-125]